MTPSTNRKRQCFLALRGAGPTSIQKLSELTGLPRTAVYEAVYRLRQENLAKRIGYARYDLTRRGRRIFEDRTCPGLWRTA